MLASLQQPLECGCEVRNERSYRFAQAGQATNTTRRSKAAALPFQGAAAALQKRGKHLHHRWVLNSYISAKVFRSHSASPMG